MTAATRVFVPTAEAAFIADLSDREMNRAVDEHILPAMLVKQESGRCFSRLGAVFASFYFKTEKELVADFRRQIVAEMTERLRCRKDFEKILGLWEMPADVQWLVYRAHAQVDLASFFATALARVQRVQQADNVIRTSPDILRGEPVFAGTRVPLRVVMSSLDNGMSFDRVRASYNFLTEELIDAARLYMRIHPRRGRPRKQLSELHPDWKLKSRTVIRPAAR